MVVINVFGDSIEEVTVCEHLCHIDNVVCSDIHCPTVVFKYIVGFLNILFTDLQVMFMEEEQRSPDVPVIGDGVKQKMVKASDELSQ